MNIEEDLLDLSILDHIEPPQLFPLTSSNILQGMEGYFYAQCQTFLKEEKSFYQCSKKVQRKLENALTGTHDLHQKLSDSSQHLSRLGREIEKLNRQEGQIRKKQELLSCLCSMVKMESTRSLLLQKKITNEEEYLHTLGGLDKIVMELKDMNSQAKIVTQLKDQLVGLLEEAVSKLIKQNLSPSLTNKIIAQYSGPFLRNPKVAIVFKQNLRSNRINYFRIALNPLINNISYSNNLCELFEKISSIWIKMVKQQKKLFLREQVNCEVKVVLKQTMITLNAELLPKLERNIYKVKDLVEISFIRFQLSTLLTELQQISNSSQWEPLLKILVKLQIFLQENLENQGEQLEIAKYNIYSLVSYIPVRQLLEKIKDMKIYEVQGSPVQWQKPFKRLADSRDPTKSPRNKSLLIFNLNIWHLYSSIIKDGQMSQRAKKVLQWSRQAFVTLSLESLKKQFQSKSFVKLLDFCSDLNAPKKILLSEIPLLGHEKLRKNIEQYVIERMIEDIYKPMLEGNKIECGLCHEQVVERAKNEKINLNKYGKQSQKLRVLNIEEIKMIFE